MLELFGIQLSLRSILLCLVHTAIETITMVVWLDLAMEATGIHMKVIGPGIVAVIVLFVGLFLEHVVALAPGKVA